MHFNNMLLYITFTLSVIMSHLKIKRVQVLLVINSLKSNILSFNLETAEILGQRPHQLPTK